MTMSWTDVWTFRANLLNSLANYILEPVPNLDNDILNPHYWQQYPIEPCNPQLESGLEQLINCTTYLQQFDKTEAVQQVMVEYTNLFIGSGGPPKAAPVQSFYMSNKSQLFGSTTSDMKQSLFDFGLESKMKDRQPEDHLGLQLLLVALQSGQMAERDETKQLNMAKEQIPFIGRHLLTWIPRLSKDAKQYGSVGFYAGLTELIWGTLLWDKKLLQEFVSYEGAAVQSS